MSFDRHQSWLGYSWAYRVFKLHHRDLNQIYWAFRPIAAHAGAMGKVATARTPTAILFGSLGADDRRVPSPVELWQPAFDSCQNWIHLAAVLSASSYLEVYLRSVIRAALESDPGVLIGAPLAVDGVALLKKRDRDYTFLPVALKCVEGKWHSRFGQYEKLFQRVPPELHACESELERIRILRNSVAHAFGRDSTAYDARISRARKPLAIVSATTLKAWLAVIERAANAVERDLFRTHIGEYETIAFYHEHRDALFRSNRGEAAGLSAELYSVHKRTPSRDFCRALVKYYRSI